MIIYMYIYTCVCVCIERENNIAFVCLPEGNMGDGRGEEKC
jgi:hypothetical protein